MANDTATPSATKKPKTGRSPAYPFIPIDKALNQARALYQTEGKYAVPMASAFRAWGYGEKSSGGRQTLAALRYFGLIEVAGEGDSRQVKVSQEALRVLLDTREDDTERRALVRKMAMRPSIHQQIFLKYREGLPSDATVRHFLVFDHDYNEGAAQELLEEYKATATYAGLYQPSGDIDESQVEDGGDPEDLPEDESPGSGGKGVPTAAKNPPAPQKPQAEYRLMESERIVFTEESAPQQYLKLIASGEPDELLLEALEDYVKRQKRRLVLKAKEEEKKELIG